MNDVWPGNECDCTGENLEIHDMLCDILEKFGYSEADVNTASVGMWGAIKVVNDRRYAEIKSLQSSYDKLRAERDEFELSWKNASMLCSIMWARSKREDKVEACAKISETYEKGRHLLYLGSILRTQEALVDWQGCGGQERDTLRAENARLKKMVEKISSYVEKSGRSRDEYSQGFDDCAAGVRHFLKAVEEGECAQNTKTK